jgi:hypothetical protein
MGMGYRNPTLSFGVLLGPSNCNGEKKKKIGRDESLTAQEDKETVGGFQNCTWLWAKAFQ